MDKYNIYSYLCNRPDSLILCIVTLLISGLLSCTTNAETKISQLPEFPLKISANAHYLTDQKGDPFLIGGDSPWVLTYKLTREEQLAYIDTAIRKGFNALLLEGLNYEKDPAYPNRYGEAPFLKYGIDGMADFSTPNPAYFDRLHWLIRQMLDRHVLALLVLADYSSYGPYWYDDVVANGEEKCYNYAKFLGDLLSDCPNILWIQGGDCDPEKALGMTEAMAQGILDSNHPSKLQTYHAGHRPSTDLFPYTEWVRVNNTYEYDSTVSYGAPVYIHAWHDYFAHGNKPTFNLETGYEGESNDQHGGLPKRIRRQVWQTMLAGSCGHMYGSIIWRFPDSWKEIQQWPGAAQVNVCFKYLNSRPWWHLVPDPGHHLIPVDYGQHNEFKIAAISGNKEWLVAYIPAAGNRSVTINMQSLKGKIISAYWLDPANGKFLTIQGTPFENKGNRTFETPGINSFGDDDWVLELTTSEMEK